MAVVQLHGADVGLQSVHGLVLLLVQHPEEGGDEGWEARREEGAHGRQTGKEAKVRGTERGSDEEGTG